MNISKKLVLAIAFMGGFAQLHPMNISDEKQAKEIAIQTALLAEEIATQKTINNELLEAVTANDLERAKTALLQGADSDVLYDKHGDTIMMRATRMGNKAMIELLINKGAQFNRALVSVSEGRTTCTTPLILATYLHRSKTVKLLLDAAANVNFTNKAGTTPLMIMVMAGSDFADVESIVRTLLHAGADYTLKDTYGVTALRHAIGNFTSFNIISAAYPMLTQAIQDHEQLLRDRKQRTDAGLAPEAYLQNAQDYLLNSPLTIRPLCDIFIQYADHNRPFTPKEAEQRSIAATMRQESIKWSRIGAAKEARYAARRQAEMQLAIQQTEITPPQEAPDQQ